MTLARVAEDLRNNFVSATEDLWLFFCSCAVERLQSGVVLI